MKETKEERAERIAKLLSEIDDSITEYDLGFIQGYIQGTSVRVSQ